MKKMLILGLALCCNAVLTQDLREMYPEFDEADDIEEVVEKRKSIDRIVDVIGNDLQLMRKLPENEQVNLIRKKIADLKAISYQEKKQLKNERFEERLVQEGANEIDEQIARLEGILRGIGMKKAAQKKAQMKKPYVGGARPGERMKGNGGKRSKVRYGGRKK